MTGTFVISQCHDCSEGDPILFRASMNSRDTFDLAVIGAGIYGIQAARTYLEIHPNDKVIILEASGEVGGVWSGERVYDDFWTQTPLRILEFSDLPLTDVPEPETYHGFFQAVHVAKYLRTYVETRIYAGQSLASRIRFHSRVKRLTKGANGWNLNVVNQEGDTISHTRYSAQKVIDATGITSSPNVPTIPGQDTYNGTILHSMDFARHQESILNNQRPQTIVVIGRAKSAADITYACAKAGKEVHWIIRRSGAGPAAFVSAKGSWPYQNSNESFYTRFTSHFLASWFSDESSTWLGRFIYKTAFGRGLLKTCWKAINRKARRFANYDRPDGTANGFHNLRPDTEIFWQNDSTGICLRPDFFDTIALKVKVYREDVERMISTGLHLSSGTLVDADCIIFATGWTTSHPNIRSGDDQQDIGLPLELAVPYREHEKALESRWREMENDAEKEVLARFPILRDQPPYHKTASTDTKTPLRLYKGMLPIKDRSIAFVGQFLLGNNFRASEVQALYSVAALDGELTLPTQEQMEESTAQFIAWDRLRYLFKGQYGSWLYWDMVPYTDDLLKELGLRSHRHQKWWKDLFAPCFASDLTGLINEYRAKQSCSEKAEAMFDEK